MLRETLIAILIRTSTLLELGIPGLQFDRLAHFEHGEGVFGGDFAGESEGG